MEGVIVPAYRPSGSVAKNLPAMERHELDPWVWKILGRKAWQPISVFLHGKSHGQRTLVGYSPRGCNKSDKTEVTEHISPYRDYMN